MSALSPAPPSPSALASSLLRHPDFVRLWTAETISQLGTQVSALAIPFVAIEILQASTFQVALLNVVDFLPFLLIGLPAGVWVDRLRRRPVMIAGDLGRAAALATIPVAFALGALTIVQLYVVGFVVGVPHGLLRCRIPELPAVGRRARPAPGGQRQAGGQPRGRRRSSVPGSPASSSGSCAHHSRSPSTRSRSSCRRSSSSRSGGRSRCPRRTARMGRPGPAMRREMAEGLRYVARPRVPQEHRRLHGDGQPLRHRRPRRSSSSSPFASWG